MFFIVYYLTLKLFKDIKLLRYILAITQIAVFSFTSFAADPIVLHDTTKRYILMGSSMEVLEDKSARLSVQEVSSAEYDSRFKTPSKKIPINTDRASAYWIKFSVKDLSAGKRYLLLEFPDFRIDTLDFFEPGPEGFRQSRQGDEFLFITKLYPYKNFLFRFTPSGETQTYYVRIKSAEQVSMFAEIETLSGLLNYSNNEYFMLALFYGIILALGIFNLFIYFANRHKAYLFYVFYILSVGVYAMTQDGLGFQYLWPSFPVLNNYIYGLSMFAMVILILFYGRSFLSLPSLHPRLNRVILIVVVARSIIFLLGISLFPELFYMPWIDLVPMFLVYYAGILALQKGFKPARLYVTGFTFLFLGFFVNALNSMGFVQNSIVAVYAYNIAVVLQMVFFAFALVDMVREAIRQKEIAEENNRELDTFIYKVSHDLKSPLKSIIGLTTVAQRDPKAQEAQAYFEMILKSTKRLDSILADLTLLTKVKQKDLKKDKIDFNELIQEILSSLQYYPSFHEMDFKVDVKSEIEFLGDRGLIYSVFQNIIENAIKYKKPSGSPLFNASVERSYLKIEVAMEMKRVMVVFSDNGLGIPAEYQEKIFDMFFRVAGTGPSGSGLGLYLVKMSMEKMGGKISVKSEEGVGSTFTLEFKNSTPAKVPGRIKTALKGKELL